MSTTKPANTPKISADEKAKFQRIASMQAWAIANEFGCEYEGDCSAIPNGGFFYDPRDWKENGYANCVSFETFSHEYDEETLTVQCGTIHRPIDLGPAFRNCDVQDEDRENVNAQICACRWYHGIEPDEDFSGRFEKTFLLKTWQEWRIWRSVSGWLRNLGE